MPEEKDYSKSIEQGKSDARTGTYSEHVPCGLLDAPIENLAVSIVTCFLTPLRREMDEDEKKVYSSARDAELNKIATE